MSVIVMTARSTVEGRFTRSNGRADLAAMLVDLDNVKKFPDRILVRSSESLQLIKTADILYVSAEGNYIRLHTNSGSYRMRERMMGMIDRLDPTMFRRIHRSHIINLDYVNKLLPWFGGDYLVMMANGSRLTLSRNYREQLQAFA